MGEWSILALGLLAATDPATAALGRPHASVEDDRAHFGATMATAPTVAVRGGRAATLQPADGGTIREYSNADGIVYAVTWRSQARPDLRQLLGDSFPAAAADMAARTGRRTARLLTVQRADLMIRSEGRPGAFFGIAWNPRLAPAGFTPDDVQ